MPPVRHDNSSQPAEDEPVDDSQIDPQTGERIPRPPNAWILFRKDQLAQLKSDSEEKTQMSEASKTISALWRKASPDVRSYYEGRAEREKADHARKYPNYRFCPKSKAQKAAERTKKKVAAKSAKAPKHKSRAPDATLTAVRNASATFHTSTQVPYFAAAMLNQGLSASVACAPEGPSPPLSLASTPVSTPSPFPSPEFEQGSSTTGTSPQDSPSSLSGLGLGPGAGPIQHFKFEAQTEASSHAPRRVPPRVPSRPRGGKGLGRSAATTGATAPPDVVALAVDGALSPLPWTLPPSSHSQSRELSPNNLLFPEAHDLSYTTEGMFEPVPFESDPGSIDMNYPFQSTPGVQDYDWASLIESGFPADGIFMIPSGPFEGEAPEEIHVNMAPEFNHGLQHDVILSNGFPSFDLSGIIPPNPLATLTAEESRQLALPQQPPFSQPEWNIDDIIHNPDDRVPSSTILTTNALPASIQPDQPVAQSSDYMTGIEEEVAQNVARAPPPRGDSLDIALLSSACHDPMFRDIWQVYLERRARLQGSSSTSLSQSEPFYVTHNYTEEAASFSERHGQPDVEELAQRASTSASTYVPPSGAANSQFRRVGGSWRPPTAQAPESAPQTPAYDRVPSWGSVASS